MLKFALLASIILSFLACGKPGSNGATGAQGPTGPQGQPSTTVTVIQFCPSSFQPSYPDTFPESGLCIGGNVYGVFSANGGFLALLPPGVYSSDGVNASCTFTIAQNCQLTN